MTKSQEVTSGMAFTDTHKEAGWEQAIRKKKAYFKALQHEGITAKHALVCHIKGKR